MKKISLLLTILVGIMASSGAAAIPIANATLSGFIQNGTISNDAGSGAAITSIVYSLGAAGDGIATWDNGTAGGVASDFLSNPRYFQTVTWSGLNILSGNDFSFSNLDIDLIQTLVPLSVTGFTLDELGTSLANASLSISWDNGAFGTTSLVQQAWRTSQNLIINSGQVALPEPATITLFMLGLAGIGFSRKMKTLHSN